MLPFGRLGLFGLFTCTGAGQGWDLGCSLASEAWAAAVDLRVLRTGAERHCDTLGSRVDTTGARTLDAVIAVYECTRQHLLTNSASGVNRTAVHRQEHATDTWQRTPSQFD